MRHSPRDEPWSDDTPSQRHPTIIAAAVRQTSGRHPAARRPARPRDDAFGGSERDDLLDTTHGQRAQRAPGSQDGPRAHRTRRPRAADEWSASDAATQIIYDRESGPFPPMADHQRIALARPRAAANTLRRVAEVALSVGRAATRRGHSTATIIPGNPSSSLATSPRIKALSQPTRVRPFALLGACASLLVALVITGMAGPGELSSRISASLWSTGVGEHALPTPIGGYWMPPVYANVPPPPSYTDARHYVDKYGFDWPAPGGSLWAGEKERMATMMPFAIAATARWDSRHGDKLEPQMLLFWTHAEGISARVSYSNCANESPPPGTTYFTHIANCGDPSFWQLGYGNQFSVIDVLKTAFIDMRGNPDDPQLVQRVGQAVLDWDRKQGTTPACGGYSCTFPAMTIDQIMAGVSLSHPTTNDWWASVLSRDPAINCYMLADALVWFSHNETRNWIGCYYAEPCWTYESNRLGDVLANWNALLAAAHM
ncbi:MAG TPA: hypothetical protein VF818_05825 [Ktedonobacterales bacterium]